MRPSFIEGGRVIDPASGLDEVTNVLLMEGVVAGVGDDLGIPDEAEVINARGKIVAPGFIDVHVHLREPGKEEAETVATGARSAAAGGYTGVCAMPNTDPVTDNQAAIGFIVKQAREAAAARVYPIGAISIGQRGERLAEFGSMIASGAVAVSDDGRPVVSSHLMRTALEYARVFDVPVADHCEDPTLADGGVMHEGVVSTRLGLKGIPSAAEEIMVARDILLAELTGGHVHLCHMSTRGSVELIRRGKDRGIRVTAEATPHHFALTHESCGNYDTNTKMNPPLREPEDVEAIRNGLSDGTIDVIATDHAPHHYESKERDFDDAPFGITGLETALGLAMVQLVTPGVMTLSELIRSMSTDAARIFGLPGGSLARSTLADVVIFDPESRWTVSADAFVSKSRNSPFLGMELVGRVERTLVGGVTVFQRADE